MGKERAKSFNIRRIFGTIIFYYNLNVIIDSKQRIFIRLFVCLCLAIHYWLGIFYNRCAFLRVMVSICACGSNGNMVGNYQTKKLRKYNYMINSVKKLELRVSNLRFWKSQEGNSCFLYPWIPKWVYSLSVKKIVGWYCCPQSSTISSILANSLLPICWRIEYRYTISTKMVKFQNIPPLE